MKMVYILKLIKQEGIIGGKTIKNIKEDKNGGTEINLRHNYIALLD